MENKTRLLKKKKNDPLYTVASNYSRVECLRISLNAECGFKKGQKVAQVLRDDGVLMLIPEKNFSLDNYS